MGKFSALTLASMALFALVASTYGFLCGLDRATCAAQEMAKVYSVMKAQESCSDCMMYFHCTGNFNAVHHCDDAPSYSSRAIARDISNCPQWIGGTKGRLTGAERVATLYGRYGGDCAERYLCRVGCGWNPNSGTCDSDCTPMQM